MRNTILTCVLAALLGCSAEEQGDTYQSCPLTFTNDPGSANEIINEAANAGATEDEAGPGGTSNGDFESNDFSETSGPVEITLCSEVIEISENILSASAALDLARSGYVTSYRVRQISEY
jgi:hypothetical protein